MRFDLKCRRANELGKCNHDCCTATACDKSEMKIINAFIRRKKLKRPLIKAKFAGGYMLPNAMGFNEKRLEEEMENPTGKYDKNRCLYLWGKGCVIYPVRPTICKEFGTNKRLEYKMFPIECSDNTEN